MVKGKASTGTIANEKGVTRFNCPNCGKPEIVRTKHQKKIAVRYTCKHCGFSGPN